jgi:hypothetical protein
LERYELDVFADEEAKAPAVDDDGLKNAARRVRQKRIAMQATLFDSVNQNLLDELLTVDVESLKPEQALEFLHDIRKRIV